MTRGSVSVLLALGLLVVVPGCGDGGGGDDTDAGTARMDGGGGGTEDGGVAESDGGGGPSDGGAASDAGAAADGSAAQDAGPTGPSCGGRGSPPCARGTFCLFPDTECGRFDGPGSCTEVPERCPDIRMPVCGCDGTTYGNRCEAYAAGVSVDSEGACTDTASGSCNDELIACRRLPPPCEGGTYPEVSPTTRCWTDRCITIDLCECERPSDCPSSGTFGCVAGRCTER